MQLSVLSALVRLNVDPWAEAIRLAAMTKGEAQRTLVSTLNLVSGQSRSQSEAEALATQLVQLLPQTGGEGPTSAKKMIAEIWAQGTNYWLVWLFFAMALSFLSPHHQATTTKSDVSSSASSTASSADRQSK